MKKILFVCHGNICRSVMAEYMMKDLVAQKGLAEKFYIESAATSQEELGCDIYPPAKRKLDEKGITYGKHRARQVKKNEYDQWDLFIVMDERNKRNLIRIFGQDKDDKIQMMLDHKEVADPWYTGNFEMTYQDLIQGCTNWLERFLHD